MRAFRVLHDRVVPVNAVVGGADAGSSDVVAVCCPAMDLIAVAGSSQLVVQRSIKWELLFRSSCSVSTMAWRPDGKALAVGQEDGLIVLFDVENGEEFNLPRAARPHSHPIVCMHWCKHEARSESGAPRGASDTEDSEDDAFHVGFRDRSSMLLAARPPDDEASQQSKNSPGDKRGAGASAVGGTEYAAALMEAAATHGLEILVSGDDAGVVTMSAFGYFSIGCVDLSGAFRDDGDNASELEAASPPRVTHVRLSDDLGMMLAVLERSGAHRLVSIDTSVLAERADELRHLASQCGQISEAMATAQAAIVSMGKQWSELTSALRRHIEPLAHELRLFERPNTPEQELFMMLTCGVTSSALQRYIEDLQEAQLAKLGRQLDAHCAALEELGTHSLTHAAQALVFRLHDLLGLAEWRGRFEVIGLDAERVRPLLAKAQLLLLKAHETLAWVFDARANLAAFTVWLQTVWRKNVKFAANPAAPGAAAQQAPLNKHLAHVDIDRLVRVLGRDLLHGHIAEQFRSAPLSPTPVPWRHQHPNATPAAAAAAAAGASRGSLGDPEHPAADGWTSATRAIDRSASLLAAFEDLNELWTVAFHATSFTVSAALKPIENLRLPDGLFPRLVDVTFSQGRFAVVLAPPAADGALTLVTRSRDPRCPQGLSEEALEVASDIRAFTDVRFYNDTSLLVAFNTNDGKRHIAQVRYAGQPEDGESGFSAIQKQRELIPSGWTTTSLVCQGKRGIAAVFTSNRRLCVLDMEDDEDVANEDDAQSS